MVFLEKLIISVIDYCKDVLNSVSNYAVLLFVMSVVFYLIVECAKRAYPNFFNKVLYSKKKIVWVDANGNEVKGFIKDYGSFKQSVCIKEKKVNKLTPYATGIIGALVCIPFVKTFHIAMVCGSIISLGSSLMDNLVQEIGTLVGSIFTFFAWIINIIKEKMDKVNAKKKLISDVDIASKKAELAKLQAELAEAEAKATQNANTAPLVR